MTERKTQIIWAVWIFAVCTVFGTAVFFGCMQWSESLFYDKLAAVASAMPKESSLVMKALKDTEGFDLEAGRVILGKYGYHGQLSGQDRYTAVLLCGGLAGGAGAVVFLFFSNRERRKLCKRVGELTEYLHQLDPTRPVTCGVNIFFNFLSSIGFGVYSDEKARKEVQKAKKAKQSGKRVKRKAVGSEFFNNLAGLLGGDFMKFGATLPPCDWRTRDAFANMDIAGYNYGINRYRRDLRKYSDRLILGSETFCSDAYRFRELAKLDPRIIGDFVWAGIDYLGEVSIGSWEYKDYTPQFAGGLGC